MSRKERVMSERSEVKNRIGSRMDALERRVSIGRPREFGSRRTSEEDGREYR